MSNRAFWEKIWSEDLSSISTSWGYKILPKITGKVLEIGCGDLTFSTLPLDADYFVGVDLSFSAAKKAKDKLDNVNNLSKTPGIVNAYAEELPFKNNSFDLVVAIETITLFGSSFLQALEEMRRVAKDKLILTFSHIDIAEMYNPEKEFIQKEDHFLLDNQKSGDKVFFTKENIDTLLKKLNLKTENLEVFTEGEVSEVGIYGFHPYSKFDSVNSRIFVEVLK